MYNAEEKQKIDAWLKKIGAQNLGIEYGYEFRPGQLLEATEVLTSIYDYDRWQNMQELIDMEIPLDLDRAFESLLYRNGIESFEMNGLYEEN